MRTRVTVQITDTAFPKVFVVPLNKQLIFGRSDEDFPDIRPDIDLVACNAIRNGISRQHAALDLMPDGGFVLMDLGSRNGTAINGYTLQPNNPHPIKNGDLVRIGKLNLTLFFEES